MVLGKVGRAILTKGDTSCHSSLSCSFARFGYSGNCWVLYESPAAVGKMSSADAQADEELVVELYLPLMQP